MAKLGTTNIGGGGGIGSDELTVTADKVIEGYMYVGADTDDEIGDGTIPSKGSSTASQSVTTSGSNLVTRIPNGAYITNASSGYPEITTSLSSIASTGGLTADKMLVGKSALGISGTATSDADAGTHQVLAGKTYYRSGSKLTGTMVNVGANEDYKWLGNDGSKLYVGMTNGAHITNSDIGYPRVLVPYSAIASNIGLSASNIKEGVSVLGRTGTMKDYSYLATGQVAF